MQDDPLRRSLAELTARIEEEVAERLVALHGQIAAAEARGLEEGERGARAPAASRHTEEAERLLDVLTELDTANSLSDVLSALLESAIQFAPRAALFIVRPPNIEIWRRAGFSESTGSVVLPLDGADAVACAARDNIFVAVPADRPPPAFAAIPNGCRGMAIPLALNGEVAAVLFADTEDAALKAEDERRRQVTMQIVARHAARCLESITALRTARFVAAGAGWPVGTNGWSRAEAETESAADADADRSAHRYARLLVSEIKLYHEDAIVAGRRHRDLMNRIGGEIARAQALYDARVPARIRQSTDYFHAEVVKMLAEGDEGLVSR